MKEEKEEGKAVYKLSNQAMGAFMLALQRCLIEETDIVGILASFELENSDDGLVVLNPPVVTFPELE